MSTCSPQPTNTASKDGDQHHKRYHATPRKENRRRKALRGSHPSKQLLPLIKHNIRLLILQPILAPQSFRLKLRNPRIVKLPPAAPRRILQHRDIMARSQGRAEVAHNCVRIVPVRRGHALVGLDGLELLWPVRGALLEEGGFFLRGDGRQHEGRHVEVVEGEFDGGADLAGALGVGRREALEVDDEVVRRAGDGDLLGGLALLLAARTAPDLVAREAFLGAVGAEAVANVGAAVAGDLDADAVKGLKGCGSEMAGYASEARHVLATEKLADDGAFAHRPTHPFDTGDVRFG